MENRYGPAYREHRRRVMDGYVQLSNSISAWETFWKMGDTHGAVRACKDVEAAARSLAIHMATFNAYVLQTREA